MMFNKSSTLLAVLFSAATIEAGAVLEGANVVDLTSTIIERLVFEADKSSMNDMFSHRTLKKKYSKKAPNRAPKKYRQVFSLVETSVPLPGIPVPENSDLEAVKSELKTSLQAAVTREFARRLTGTHVTKTIVNGITNGSIDVSFYVTHLTDTSKDNIVKVVNDAIAKRGYDVLTSLAGSGMAKYLSGAVTNSNRKLLDCSANDECSDFGSDCLPKGCPCDSSSTDCGDDLHCVSVEDAVSSNFNLSFLWGDLFSSSTPRYCFEYDKVSSPVFNDVAEWVEKNECTLCEDAGKVTGLIVQGAEDVDGVGEAQSIAMEAITTVVKGNMPAEVCESLADPIADFVNLIDININEDELGKCLTEICATAWEAIIDSAGLLLFAEVLGVIAALSCECTVPYTNCTAIM